MPTLLVPAALTALAALVLPLLIHLARRTEQRPTDFAALRWLRAKPRPRQRPRFEEWPLLITRLLLLALIAFWLARPVTPATPDRRAHVYVVPGVKAPTLAKDVEGHWLAPGFPALDRPAPRGAVPVMSLVRELDAALPPDTPVRILVPAIIEGADAERPRLSRKVAWQVVPGAMTPPRPETPRLLKLTVRADPGADPGRSAARYLAAVAAAWGPVVDLAPLDAPLPPRDTVVAWLGTGAMPAKLIAWVKSGGTALVPQDVAAPSATTATAARDGEGRPFLDVMPLGRGHVYRFTRALTPPTLPALVEPDFPDRLRAAIRPPALPVRAFATHIAPEAGAAPAFRAMARREWRDALALLIAVLFVLERWLATAKRRWRAP
ncbi:BatA domain-containing protein [uncultured Sphingomonas sp.]|uniref:BatA domain-containing protein n=1 Tax=uncultured Sphingomonas sp. TaxID=158754 RepID=UPI0025F09A01|nr:BatA domain-containing protein [uncultured Sphingomonas sp.]